MRAVLAMPCALAVVGACADGADASGKDQTDDQAAPAAGETTVEREQSASCSARRSRNVAFTRDGASDTVTIRVDAERCAEAAALVTVRDGSGALLFADAFKLEDLALQDPPAPGRLDELLSSFTENVSTRPASELQPFEAATTEGPENPTAIRPVASRSIYERAREAGGTVLCFNVHYSTTECLWRDAERGGTFHLYYAGT